MANLTNALQQLRAERQVAQLHVEKLDQAISVIESLNGSGASRKASRPTRIISAASRRKMAQAQRARWAKAKGQAPKAKRTLSAAGRKRIATAQRARWAKLKAGKKAA
jgi:phage major head subunit gpT-like protein